MHVFVKVGDSSRDRVTQPDGANRMLQCCAYVRVRRVDISPFASRPLFPDAIAGMVGSSLAAASTRTSGKGWKWFPNAMLHAASRRASESTAMQSSLLTRKLGLAKYAASTSLRVEFSPLQYATNGLHPVFVCWFMNASAPRARRRHTSRGRRAISRNAR